MFLIGLLFFLLPFILNIVVFSKRIGIKQSIFTSLYSYLIFILIFRFLPNRTLVDISLHIINPTFKFFIQFYFLILFSLSLLNYIFLNTENKINRVSKKIKILQIFSAFFILIIFWASQRFPLGNAKTVFFNLQNNALLGLTKETVIDFILYVLLPTVITLFVLFYANKNINNISFNIKSKQLYFNKLFTILLFVYAISLFIFKTSLWHYPTIIKKYFEKPVFSEFYDKYYVNPDNVNIIFPKNKQNLIFILLESMESSFADKENGGIYNRNIIPNLTLLAKENINFSETQSIGGGINVEGTGWTSAAFLSKLAGIPFATYNFSNSQESLISLVPYAPSLNSILAKNGYNQTFIFGSDKNFGSRGAFLEGHGNVKVKDLNYYKSIGKLPKNYKEFWGFEDLKLYEYAKEELLELSKNKEPFFLGLLTVDSHFPEGYICPSCIEEDDNQIINAIECADRQIYDFINWVKNQDFYKNTTIVITGDHLFMTNEKNRIFNNHEDLPIQYNEKHEVIGINQTKRRWHNIFINSVVKPKKEKERLFSSFDIFPSTLEAMGVYVENSSLGLGRSLFSDKKTLLEELDLNYINLELTKKTTQYEYFQTGKVIK